MAPKIVHVTALDKLRLLLTFETGERKIFDVSPYVRGELYEELRNPAYFKQVGIVHGGRCVAWPNDQDISPEDLYELSVPATF